MSKKENVVTIAEEQQSEVKEEPKQKTSKKYLKKMETLTRQLDRALTDLNVVALDAEDLKSDADVPQELISNRDYARIVEFASITTATSHILYQLVNRMARKYIGKEIDPIDVEKRKSLKVK